MPGSPLLGGHLREEISVGNPGCLPARLLSPSSPSRQAPAGSCLFKAANRTETGAPSAGSTSGLASRSRRSWASLFVRSCSPRTRSPAANRPALSGRAATSGYPAAALLTLRFALPCRGRCFASSFCNRRNVTSTLQIARFPNHRSTSGFRLGRLRLSPRAAASTAARLKPDERRDLG